MNKIPVRQKAALHGKTIFVSRQLTESSPLLELARHGHVIHAESLISISRIRFTHTPKTDWIFFSSKNSIRHFFAQDPELAPNAKFAVMGESSARFLRTYQKEPEFIGKGVDVAGIAKDFAKKIGNGTVLLPQAIDSYQSIQKYLSFSNNCFNLFVYKTSLKSDFEIPEADILVFTSPSNAKAYFSKYKADTRQKVVAMGSTTAKTLGFFGVKDPFLPHSFSESGLLDVLEKLVKEKEIKK